MQIWGFGGPGHWGRFPGARLAAELQLTFSKLTAGKALVVVERLMDSFVYFEIFTLKFLARLTTELH